MIIEERIYILQPGGVPEYLRIYEAEGMAIQTRILGDIDNDKIHLLAQDRSPIDAFGPDNRFDQPV